ncbi:MAG: hypothetical protein RI928_2331 [Pseudomonadota bacterium]|jgi:hypothetical protein
MQAAVTHAARNKRNVVILNPGIDKKKVCEIYDAVRTKAEQTIVRAGTDGNDNFYVYMPKRENRIAAATYKAASIRHHRQAMGELLDKSANILNHEKWIDKKDKDCISQLNHLSTKDVARAEFTVGELKPHLKPLNDSVRARDRWVKRANLNRNFSPLPKKDQDYYAQFLNKTKEDKNNLRVALFGDKNLQVSMAEERAIVGSIDKLLQAYLNRTDKKQSLESFIQQSPEKDLLLRFANAWLDHSQRPEKFKAPNLLHAFSWNKAITDVARRIQTQLKSSHAKKSADSKRSLFSAVSPAREKGLAHMLESSRLDISDDIKDEIQSPFKAVSVARPSGLMSLGTDDKRHVSGIIADTVPGPEIEVPSLTEDELSSEDTSLFEGHRMMRASEGAYTIYVKAPVAEGGDPNATLPVKQ